MKCVYCPIHSEVRPKNVHPRVIDVDFAKRGIDDYFDNGFFDKNEKRGIRIFSNGEATMEFETVKEIVAYARRQARNNLFVEMQTNGYFGVEIADWMGQNVDLLWISLDGLADIQDLQRPTLDGKSGFLEIDRNIKRISRSRKTKTGVRATISVYNNNRQKELIDYAVKNGIAAVCPDPWASVVPVSGQPDLFRFADEFVDAWHYAKARNIAYSTEMTVNFDEEVEIYCRSCSPAPQFTPDGYVSSCDMVNRHDCFLAKVFPELIFGRYDPQNKIISYNHSHIKKIKSRNIRNLKECAGCPALKHCAGGCIGVAMAASLDFYGVNKQYCPVVRYLFKKMPDLVNSGYDKNIPIHP